MDIGSNGKWPGCALSNFAAHEFEIDGVKCASMEGFLQSLKHKNPDMQREICSYVGIKAKRAGGTHWMRHQKLYWKGVAYVRTSQAYQDLLDRAYDALYQNEGFKAALTLHERIGMQVVKQADCKSAPFGVRGFKSYPIH